MSAAQLSFPASQVAKLAALDGVEDAAGSLTLNAVSISGTVPEGGFQRPAPGTQPQTRRAPFDVKSLSVTGVDETKPALTAIGAGQITAGRSLRSGAAREAVLNVSYARRNGIKVGETIKLKGKTFTVVGLARSPLGGQASDAYVKLAQLQALSGRKGRVNSVQVRARSTGDVAAVEKRIERALVGRLGRHRRRPRRPRRRLAGRRQGPVRQARHGADHRRARGGVPDRVAADALLGHQAHPRARDAEGDRLARAPRRAPGDRRVGRAGRARRRLRGADRDRRRGARLGAGADARGERGRPARRSSGGPGHRRRRRPSSGSARRRSPPAPST